MQDIHPATRYDPIAVTLHWIIALSIIFMIPLGLLLDDLPMSIRFGAYTLHKSIGITVLALSIFRLIWRFMNPPPPLPATVPPHERVLAKAVHWVLYFLMIAMPLTGWLMVSANPKYPTVYFWFTEVPFLPMPEGINPKETHEMFEGLHAYLAYGAIVLILGHLAAALKHHFVNHDSVLRHMLPLWLQRKPGTDA
jgi:cytochrome b561